ncbi:MAG TPA: serine/threonine-protein kinase [Planctomycetota bacterium]|nr:serine/threonine-protein kinase [Planctomycetota bacterium]
MTEHPAPNQDAPKPAGADPVRRPTPVSSPASYPTTTSASPLPGADDTQALAPPDEFKNMVKAAASSTELPVVEASAALPPAEIATGALVGNYRIRERLGRGSMGETYLAEQPASGEMVAIKFLNRGASRRWTARFDREVRCQSAVQSPYTVTCQGAGIFEGRRYMVLQYVPGVNLHILLKQLPTRRLAEERALRISYQVLKALQALETQSFLHRDIKPQNVLISGQDNVHLSDFGLVRDLKEPPDDPTKPPEERRITPPNTTLGTAEYMSPEQSLGAELDIRSDLYSLGAVLYRSLTGVPPFRGATTAQTLELVIQKPLTPVRELNPDVAPRTARLVERLLSKKRNDRPRTTGEVEGEMLACFKEARQSVRARAIEEEQVRERTRAPLAVGLAIVGISFVIGFVTALVLHYVR